MRTLIFIFLLAFATPLTARAAANIEFKVATHKGRLNLRKAPSPKGAVGAVIAQLDRGSRVQLDWDALLQILNRNGVSDDDREAFLTHSDCRTLGTAWQRILTRVKVAGTYQGYLPVTVKSARSADLHGFVATNYLTARDLTWSCEDFQTTLVKRAATAISRTDATCAVECILSKAPPANLSREISSVLAQLLGPEDHAIEAAKQLAENADALCPGSSASTSTTEPIAALPDTSFAVAPRNVELKGKPAGVALTPGSVAPRPRVPGAPTLSAHTPSILVTTPFAAATPETDEVRAPAQQPLADGVFRESTPSPFRLEVGTENGFGPDQAPNLTVFSNKPYSPNGSAMRPNLADASCPRNLTEHNALFAWYLRTKDTEEYNRCLLYRVEMNQGTVGIRGPESVDTDHPIQYFSILGWKGQNTDEDGTIAIGREYRFLTPETARNAEIQIVDQMTSSISNNISKVLMVFPRKNKQVINQLADGRMEVTLTTGEKVHFDPITKRLIAEPSSALVEADWVNTNPDRFKRRVSVDYQGSGIAVSIWSRTFRSPVDAKGFGMTYAEISQPDLAHPGKRIRCSVKADKLWFQDQPGTDDRFEEFKFGTDAEFMAFVKTISRNDETGKPCKFSF